MNNLTYFGRVWKIFLTNWPALLRGAETTLIIAFVSTAVGCLIGFAIGVVKTIPIEKNTNPVKKALLRVVNVILTVYIEVFRGTPMMAQAAFIYYGYLSISHSDPGMWIPAFFIVSINTGAYMAETVRGGILSIDPGQTEGAKAVGMTHYQTMTSVILPQALRNVMPQIGNNLIINIKDTSVLGIIGTVELMFAARTIVGANYRFFETYTITMVMYLIMTLFFSRILREVEKRMAGNKSYDLATRDTLAHTSGMHSFIGEETRGR